MTKFLTAIESGIEASLDKEKNIKEILSMVDQVKHEVESFSKGKVTLELASPYEGLGVFLKTIAIAEHNKVNNGTDKPADKILKAVLVSDKSISERLTVIEFGTQGYPCTIKVDGDELSAGDSEGLERIFVRLLGSPVTGKKLRKLVGL
ncbi:MULTISPECIES: hypothetical protein [unclassified Acinetobacter]|uniref:hypothetical protein n=1 Tax=unclassified Acinetobacter TaxID=196816 RepID=UPI0018EC1621|nr:MULTISPECIES: hypothetical protein [unclassified Acinetobacter]MBJ6350927.1 hypothetical protein [Acinetobacter sp. c1]MBM0956553.1 hypothetical protein [Acinetobacter sp. C13]